MMWFLVACGGGGEPAPAAGAGAGADANADAKADGSTDSGTGGEEDHSHDEESLGTVMIGDMAVELAQGHGAVVAGKEGHLVVKLPDSGGGAAIVRAWIGTADRTASLVGKGDYAISHDDYDVHAVAPDPLPDGTQWWIEIQKPDGTKVVGAVDPIL